MAIWLFVHRGSVTAGGLALSAVGTALILAGVAWGAAVFFVAVPLLFGGLNSFFSDGTVGRRDANAEAISRHDGGGNYSPGGDF